jgi:anti-sigma factor RsiW
MCDLAEKLIPWMDGELPEREAVTIEEHFKDCKECRASLVSYRQASDGFTAYCDAAVAASMAETRRETPRWVLATAGVAAAVAFLLVLPPKHRLQSPTAVKPTPTPTAVTVGTSTPEVRSPGALATDLSSMRAKPAKAKSSEHLLATRPPVQLAESVPAGPSLEITFPSDAMFPPGAMPEGMSFVANVTLGPDGSAERLGLRPSLAEFERRANQ